MGRRGPAPTPTALKIARGAQPCRINRLEPVAIEGDPTPIIVLDADARAEWDRLLPILRAMGVLSKGDGAALTVYCVAFSDWKAAREDVDKDGRLLFDDYGKAYPNPSIAMGAKALDTLTRFIKEFGLTPSSRSSIKMDAKPETDELDEFRKRRKTK